MSDNYCYQKFFNLLDTESIDLKGLHYKNEARLPLVAYPSHRCLFDDPSTELTRSIKASWLDSHIDTESEFKHLLNQMKGIGKIVIINDRPKCSNPIYKNYSKEMLRSFIKAFQDNNIQCFWTDTEQYKSFI